ncbi:hypothetical protein AGMMS49983_21140 [Clostridia bacterium]|nr:hypothetical protein AGMMS49983_21140 [Clostridia bacterium]
MKTKKTVQIILPEGEFHGEKQCCKNCRFSYYDTSSKGNWYCKKHNTHYDAYYYCGHYEPE